MGCWNSSCLISGLPIPDDAEVYVMLVGDTTDYAGVPYEELITPPVLAVADDYGRFTVTETNPFILDRYQLGLTAAADKPSRFSADDDDDPDKSISRVLNGQNNTIMVMKSVVDAIMEEPDSFWLCYPETYKEKMFGVLEKVEQFAITGDALTDAIALSRLDTHATMLAIDGVSRSLTSAMYPSKLVDNPDRNAIVECWDRTNTIMAILRSARRPIAPNPHVGDQHGGYHMIHHIGNIARRLHYRDGSGHDFATQKDDTGGPSDIVGTPITPELATLIRTGKAFAFSDIFGEWTAGYGIGKCPVHEWRGALVVLSLDGTRAEFVDV